MAFVTNWLDQLQQEEDKKKEAQNATEANKALSGMQLQYNPIEEVIGPDGKKTVQLRKEFQLEGPEKYLESERARLGLEKAKNLDVLERTAAQQEAQQRANLATRGGLKGTNPMLLSRYSMRDALMGKLGLMGQSAQQEAELESRGQQLTSAAKEQNLKNLMTSVTGVNQFELEKWKKQKEVEAAKYQAQATRESGRK